jgi:hypothetical protein
MASELQPEATAPTGTGPRGDIPEQAGIDYRRVQQPTEMRQPWHIPVSGAAAEADELSKSLKDFGKGFGELGDKMNLQAGKEAGARAGLDPGFQPRTGLAALTAFGAGYNASAHVVYVANTQTSIESSIDAAEQAFPHDPIGFQNQVQQARKATLAETPALYQPEVQTMFDRRIEAGHNRIAEATIKQGQQDGVAAYTGTLESRIKNAVRTAADLPNDKSAATIQKAAYDNATMADALVASNAISKERAVAWKAEFQDKITEEAYTHHAEAIAGNWVSTARTTQDITSGDRALASYVNDPANSNEDKARVGAEYARQREAFEHQQGSLHAPEVQALADHIEQIPGEKEGRGAFGPGVLASIDSMRKQGWISTETARGMSVHATLNAAKGQKDDTDTYNVNEVMQGRADKFDPRDPKAAKAVDTAFKTNAAADGLARGSGLYNDLAVSYMQGTSIIPPTVRKGIIGDIASGNADVAAAASKLQARLKLANPDADIYQEDARAATRGHILEQNLEAGMPNQQAYAMMREQVDVSKEVEDTRKIKYDEAIKAAPTFGNMKDANVYALTKKLDSATPYFQKSPPISVAMRAENDRLVSEFYTRTGDLPQAQDLAYQQLQKTWRTTTVNGKDNPELLQWGPPAAQVPIIRAGIAQIAKAAGVPDDPATIKLTPYPGTALSNGNFWLLTRANGQPVLDSKNQPARVDIRQGNPSYEALLAKQKAADEAGQLAKGMAAVGVSSAVRESVNAGAAGGG